MYTCDLKVRNIGNENGESHTQKGIVGRLTFIVVVIGAFIGMTPILNYVYDARSISAPYSKQCSIDKNIDVKITSFQVQFVYTGSAKDYLALISQTPNSYFETSAQGCPLYFVDGIIVSGVNGSSHVFSDLSLSPNSFVFASNGGFSGPQVANEIFPDFTMAYIGDASYTGPLVINIYSSS